MLRRVTCRLAPELAKAPGNSVQQANLHRTLQAALLTDRLAKPWAKLDAWRILDTGWQGGRRFEEVLSAWLDDVDRPRMLHYVAICESLDEAAEIKWGNQRAVAELERLWQRQSRFLAPGFNRITFEAGQVLLTLCVGPLQPMLLAQRFVADTVLLPNLSATAWSEWSVKALLRCSRLGTFVMVEAGAANTTVRLQQQLERHGFQAEKGLQEPWWVAQLRPSWALKTSRRPFAEPPLKPAKCVVVGAGLAGASVAAAMARRGWQVQVLDKGRDPAAGASGLPVGLMAPLPSAGHSVQSRCVAAGIKLTTEQTQRLLVQNEHWAQSGVMTCEPGAAPLWQPEGAWVKPASLVKAWLNQPNVEFKGGVNVAKLEPISTGSATSSAARSTDPGSSAWALFDSTGREVACADLVILACAAACEPLGTQYLPEIAGRLHASMGQISWAMHESSEFQTHLPRYPINGKGHLLAQIPFDSGLAWFAGATYITGASPNLPVAEHHTANFLRLEKLCPNAADIFQAQFASSAMRAWQGFRCGCTDRMPVLARVAGKHLPTLCVVTGFGSRGLSWSTLCAELTAASLSGEPLPLEGHLADCLSSQRFQPG